MPVSTAVGSSARQRISPRTISLAVHHQSAEPPATPRIQVSTGPVGPCTTVRTEDRMISRADRPPIQIIPRPLFFSPPPGGRRHARRYSRCSAVVKDTAKATVKVAPMIPVAALVASGVAKDSRMASNDVPLSPSRSARIATICSRTLVGVSAAIRISSGNNETNALAASATDRSTNSTSSSRDHNRPSTVFSSSSA